MNRHKEFSVCKETSTGSVGLRFRSLSLSPKAGALSEVWLVKPMIYKLDIQVVRIHMLKELTYGL